jgi:spermidine/putrescine transport system substrate-binding protein
MKIRSFTRRRFLQNALWGAAGVSLSGCGWRLADVRNQVVETTRTGNLHIYTWSSYINDTLLNEFQKQTGFKGISEVMPSNEEMMTAFAAGKAKVFSVLCPSDYAVEEMKDKGYLQPLDMAKIQGLETVLPNLAENGMIGEQRYSVPLTWGTTGLLYNSEKIPEPPTDWDMLWRDREKLTRRMTLLDDIREVFGAVLHSLGYSQNTTDLGQLKAAYEKLQQLKPHLANFTTDAWRDPLVAGDIWIAMGYSTDATDLMKENPKIRYVIPKSGTNLWVDTMSIPITAPNVDAAYDWINYVSDPAKSAQLTATLGYVPVTQAAIDLLSPEIRSDPVKFPPQEVLARCETMKKLPEAVTAELDKYWTQVKT